MQEKRRYVISLEDVQFSDDGNSGWVHLLPYTEVNHPQYGEVVINEEKVAGFVKNFEGNVVGTDLMVDYEHRNGPEGGRAAAWFSALEQRDDGMWGQVSFVPRAAQAIKDGEYRYMSSEYFDEYTPSKKGSKKYKDVFMGAALTNRPFMKDLNPVNLAELDDFDPPSGQFPPEEVNYRAAFSSTQRCLNCKFFMPGTSSDDADADGDGGSCLVVAGVIDPDWLCDCFVPMYADSSTYQEPEEVTMEEFLKKLAVALGMPEDAGEEKVFAEVIKRVTTSAPEPVQTEDAVQKAFAEQFPEQAATLKALEERNLALEIKDLVKSWTSDAKFGVPPALLEDLTGLRKMFSDDLAVAFDTFMTKLTGTGLVRMGEKGGTDPTKMGDASEQFLGLVRKYREEHEKVSFGDAVRAVSKAHPDLAKAYTEERPKLSGGSGEAVAGEGFIDS